MHGAACGRNDLLNSAAPARGDGAIQQEMKSLSDKLALLEQRNNALSSRIASLESEIRELATKVVSSPSASVPASPSGSTGGQ